MARARGARNLAGHIDVPKRDGRGDNKNKQTNKIEIQNVYVIDEGAVFGTNNYLKQKIFDRS